MFISLAFEAPNIISYLDRIQTTFFSQPIPKAVSSRPSTRDVILTFIQSPLLWMRSLFTLQNENDLNEKVSQEELKNRRIQRFYHGFSIVTAIGFFISFTLKNGIFRPT